MNFFVFRSGVPFAYLVFFLALLVLIIGGTVMCFTRRRAMPRLPIWKPMVVVVAALAVLAVNVYVEEAMELSPDFTDASLVGEWLDGSAVLTLSKNGEYRCRGRACDELGTIGLWQRRETFDVVFRPHQQPPVLRRVIRFQNHLYFAHPILDDPDLWDGKLTFQARARAS